MPGSGPHGCLFTARNLQKKLTAWLDEVAGLVASALMSIEAGVVFVRATVSSSVALPFSYQGEREQENLGAIIEGSRLA